MLSTCNKYATLFDKIGD